MKVYKNSNMTMFSHDSGEWDHPCEVRISGSTIAVSYKDESHLIVYNGDEIEPGHFKLLSQDVGGRATLHRYSGEDMLEGYWVENKAKGMWRVQLIE